MDLVIMSDRLKDYLDRVEGVVDLDHPLVRTQIEDLRMTGLPAIGMAELAFHFVRDEIEHSFDVGGSVVSISASDTLFSGEGICFAKAHLLAAILRGVGVPVGFCYQRVQKSPVANSEFVLHGLNAIYLDDIGWFRVDPRGNKDGVYSSFRTDKEDLAYSIRPELGEVDYPYVFANPLTEVIDAMKESKDCEFLFNNRPEKVAITQ